MEDEKHDDGTLIYSNKEEIKIRRKKYIVHQIGNLLIAMKRSMREIKVSDLKD